jgi:hypothetical protein
MYTHTHSKQTQTYLKIAKCVCDQRRGMVTQRLRISMHEGRQTVQRCAPRAQGGTKSTLVLQASSRRGTGGEGGQHAKTFPDYRGSIGCTAQQQKHKQTNKQTGNITNVYTRAHAVTRAHPTLTHAHTRAHTHTKSQTQAYAHAGRATHQVTSEREHNPTFHVCITDRA